MQLLCKQRVVALPVRRVARRRRPSNHRPEKPSLASVRTACPGCNFTDALPGPFGLKVPERTQHGAPLASLVCGNETNDCPPGAVCSERKAHCARSR